MRVAGQQATEDELRAHLREKLPAYAIPSDFVLLARMPLNPNGKIDKVTRRAVLFVF